MEREIMALAAKMETELIQLRRHLHMFPELSGREFRTSECLQRALKEIGLTAHPICDTGISAVINGGHLGKTILLRADMDALPVQESTGLSFTSQNSGVMHACGHDIHMTCVIGAAAILTRLRMHLHGHVKLMFQPCEEDAPGGAARMIAEGILENPSVDAALAMHVTPEIETGKYLFSPGAVTASPSWFSIRVIGKGGHASEPEKCIDPIAAAHQIYQCLHHMASKYGRSVISVTVFQSGSTQNIIPGEALIKGTVRTFSGEHTELIHSKLGSICKEIEVKTGAECHLEFRTSMGSVFNNNELTEIFRYAVSQFAGDKALMPSSIYFKGGDDFSFIADRVPSVYLFAGVRPHDQESYSPLHSAHFFADERMIAKTAGLLASCIGAYLNKIRHANRNLL